MSEQLQHNLSKPAQVPKAVLYEHVEKQRKVWEQLKEGCAVKIQAITPMGDLIGEPFWVFNFSWGHLVRRLPTEVTGPGCVFHSYDVTDAKKRNVGRQLGSYALLAWTEHKPSVRLGGPAVKQLERNCKTTDPL